MLKLNQRGVIPQIFLLILLGIGLFAALYLSRHSTNLFPKAASNPINTPSTSFILSPGSSIVNVGEMLAVKLLVRTDVSPTNLYSAKINFNKDLFSVDHIDITNTFIKNWVEQYSDNNLGVISLVGGYPNGYQTDTNNPPSIMAVIYLKALKVGTATLSFANDSAIYANADNIDILTSKDSLTIALGTGGTPQPTISPTPTPVSTPNKPDLVVTLATSVGVGVSTSSNVVKIVATIKNVGTTAAGASVLQVDVAPGNKPAWRVGINSLLPGENQIVNLQDLVSPGEYQYTATADADSKIDETDESNNIVKATVTVSAAPLGSGDGNNDSKVNFIDLSILLADFNKTTGFRKGIDMNGDGVINTFDFSLILNLLVKNGLIKG